jgi:hypothetical protein
MFDVYSSYYRLFTPQRPIKSPLLPLEIKVSDLCYQSGWSVLFGTDNDINLPSNSAPQYMG